MNSISILKSKKGIILLIFNLLFLSVLQAQRKNEKVKGWEITFQPQFDVLTQDTTQEGQQKADVLRTEMRNQLKDDKLQLVLDVTSNYIRLTRKDRREAIYLVNKMNDSAYFRHEDTPFRHRTMKFLKDIPFYSDKFILTNEYKKILGYRCRKAILKRTDDDVQQLYVWFTPELPKTYWPKMAYLKEIPGGALQIEAVDEKTKMGIIAKKIKRSKWPLSHFLPEQKKSSLAKKPPSKTIRPNYFGGSAFKFGFARITKKDTATVKSEKKDHFEKTNRTPAYEASIQNKYKTFYIDTTGKVAFNRILKGSFLAKKYQTRPDEVYQGTNTELPTQYVLVQKDNQYGVLNVDGQWILKPEYNGVNTRLSSFWSVQKDGKESLFTGKGFLLPFQFEKVYMMNDEYFNVLQNGKWGVYNRKTKTLSVPAMYDDMDYCYGCEAEGDYLFAKKDGKWGIVDFHNKVLLPFKYDHKHWNMRSDEWITSLYKNGQQLAINLKTGMEKVYQPEREKETDSTELAQRFIRVRKGDKYGLLNSEGKQILPYEYNFIRYDAASPNSYYLTTPYVQVNKDGRWGIADTTGRIIVPPIYTPGISFKLDHFICEKEKNNSYTQVLLDKNGKRVLDSDYAEIKLTYTYNDSIPYFKLKQNDRVGFYNPATQTLVQPKYDRINDYLFDIGEKNTIKVSVNGHESLVNVNTAKAIIPPLYHTIYRQDSLNKALFIVMEDEQSGIYDISKKKLTIPLQYSHIYFTGEKDLLQVRENEKWGMLTTTGKVVVPLQYFEIQDLKKGFYLLTQQDSTYRNTFSFYDSQKQSIRKAPDSTQAIYNDHFAIIKEDGKAKLWNPIKDKIIKGAYAKNGFPDQINYFNKGLAVAYKKGEAGVIDTLGKVIIPFQYEGLSDFHKGYALVLADKEPGVEGDEPFNQTSRDFLSGFRHYGLIDSTGTIVVPPKYDVQWESSLDQYFKDDKLILYKGNVWRESRKMGLADLNGKTIIPPEYDQIILQKNGSNYLVERDKKFGIINAQGEKILPVEFDNVALQERPFYQPKYKLSFPVLAQKNGIWQYYKKDGKALPDIKIDHMIPFEKGIY